MKKGQITVSNVLTVLRIILSPIVFYCLWNSYNFAAAGIFLIGVLTDTLDGYLARLLKEVTLIGKVLDPFADKFLIGFTFTGIAAREFLIFRENIIWLMLAIIIVYGTGYIFFLKKNMKVTKLGKYCTAFQGIILITMILGIVNMFMFLLLALSLLIPALQYLKRIVYD